MEHWDCPKECQEHCCPRGCEQHKVRNLDEELKQEIIKMKEDPVLVIFKRLNWLTDEIKKLNAYIFDGRTQLVDTRTANLMMDKREKKTEHEFYERWNKLVKKNNEIIEQNDKLVEQIDTVPNQMESYARYIEGNTANVNTLWDKMNNIQTQIDFIARHIGVKEKIGDDRGNDRGNDDSNTQGMRKLF